MIELMICRILTSKTKRLTLPVPEAPKHLALKINTNKPMNAQPIRVPNVPIIFLSISCFF